MAAVKSLSDLVFQVFGIRTFVRANPLVSSVGVSAAKIASINPRRVGLIVVNLSLAAVYISPAPDVSSTKGIYLPAGGGAYVLKWQDDFELLGSEFYAIASAAASGIYVLENIMIGES